MLNPTLRALMFSKDFKKHCEAAQSLMDVIQVRKSVKKGVPGYWMACMEGRRWEAGGAAYLTLFLLFSHTQDSPGDIAGTADLLFRWSVLRIVESNTQSLVKTLDFVKAVVELMAQANAGEGEGGDDVSMNGFTPMSDYEAKLLLPALVEKSGHNQVLHSNNPS